MFAQDLRCSVDNQTKVANSREAMRNLENTALSWTRKLPAFNNIQQRANESFLKPLTFSRSSTKASFPPFVKQRLSGPLSTLQALTRSSLRADANLAQTDSTMTVAGTPLLSASITAHLPVPFWAAASLIFSTKHSPVIMWKRYKSFKRGNSTFKSPFSSLDLRISAVFSSNRHERLAFHLSNTCQSIYF